MELAVIAVFLGFAMLIGICIGSLWLMSNALKEMKR